MKIKITKISKVPWWKIWHIARDEVSYEVNGKAKSCVLFGLSDTAIDAALILHWVFTKALNHRDQFSREWSIDSHQILSALYSRYGAFNITGEKIINEEFEFSPYGTEFIIVPVAGKRFLFLYKTKTIMLIMKDNKNKIIKIPEKDFKYLNKNVDFSSIHDKNLIDLDIESKNILLKYLIDKKLISNKEAVSEAI